MLRTVLAVGAALLTAILAVRDAAVRAFGEQRPQLAAVLWRDHPTVSTQLGLAEIGRATAEQQVPDAATLESLREVLRRDPLAAEPFLIEGTNALSAGKPRRAEALLSEAVRRNPRLPAARYLLADLYVRERRTADGLRQIAALARRLPKAAAPLTPSLAAFAKEPGAAAQVRTILERNPELRANVLGALAADPANAELVLELAGPQPRGQVLDWQPRLLTSLVKAGGYERAYRLWARFSGLPAAAEPGLFNPHFRPGRALPPFDWTLAAGAAGVAEPAAGNGLHVLFYGRENAVLASQVLLLKPGSYRLRHEVRGTSAIDEGQLSWALTCLPGSRPLAEAGVSSGELAFTVPPSCRAQELQLHGAMAEVPATVDLTITGLQLTRGGKR